MPYNPRRGLGLSDQEYGKKNDVDPSDRGQWGGRDYERRNSDYKHGRHNYEPPPPDDTGKYSQNYSDPGAPSSDSSLSDAQNRFLTDFDNDFSNTHRSNRGPHAPYTGMNNQILEMKWKEWLQKAEEYGLSEDEAEDALQQWLALND